MSIFLGALVPSINFRHPEPIHENQETIHPSLFLSDLQIQLYLKAKRSVFTETDPDGHLSNSEINFESSLYFDSQSLREELITELAKADFPEGCHDSIASSILTEAQKRLGQYDFVTIFPTTPILLAVDIRCIKFYCTTLDVISQWVRSLTIVPDSFNVPSYDDESDDDDDDGDGDDDDEYGYDSSSLSENEGTNDDDGMIPATESSIKSLVVKSKKKGGGIGGEEEGSSCPICLEDFLEGSEMRCMPCSHMFHEECITNWLSRSHYCPVCRFEMPTTMSKE